MRNYRTIILFLVASFVTAVCHAFEVNGIKYSITADRNCSVEHSNYFGNIVIPKTVMYNNVEYTVTAISSYCFESTGIVSVTIPNTVTEMGIGAFWYCKSLTSVSCLATIPPTIDSETFTTFGDLHVLPGSGNLYHQDEYWSKFNIIEDAVDSIDDIYFRESPLIMGIYSTGGIQSTAESKGIKIIRYNNGSVKKVINR